MQTVMVRYHPRPELVDDNQRLVEAVYDELEATRPAGLRYATYRLDDGTFVHIAHIEGDPNPLAKSAAFARFQEGIGERCLPGEAPDARPAMLVGSYGPTAGG